MYLGLLFMLACAIAYYRIGETEYQKGFLLAGISILVWLGTTFGLAWGWPGSLGAQAGIFVVLILINMWRHRPR